MFLLSCILQHFLRATRIIGVIIMVVLYTSVSHTFIKWYLVTFLRILCVKPWLQLK